MRWDHSADKMLLLSILETHKITIDLETVARKLGNGCTAVAVYEHIKSLKKRAKNNNKDMGNKPIALERPGGGTKKGYFSDGEEDIKPVLHLPKVEQPETEMEEKQMIKQEGGQPETKFSPVIIT